MDRGISLTKRKKIMVRNVHEQVREVIGHVLCVGMDVVMLCFRHGGVCLLGEVSHVLLRSVYCVFSHSVIRLVDLVVDDSTSKIV